VRNQLFEDPFASLGARSAEEILADRHLATLLVTRAPTRIRATAWAHYVDGLAPAEVATALGITRRTVDNHLVAFVRGAQKLVKREAL
jgi:DNA-directed RNA polymerase specialized sigma24 family protein